MKRRSFLTCTAGGLFFPGFIGSARALAPFDFQKSRAGYLARIASIRKQGQLPVIDIESSYDPRQINLSAFTRSMDRAGIAMMCLSVDQPGEFVQKGIIWSHHALEAFEQFPTHFIPTGNGGNHPAWTKMPDKFLDEMERYVIEHRYPLMGEFEVRHYPSPRQIERGDLFRDVDFPINGAHMQRVFKFAETTGIPFQIHYEIEDRLLDPLEKMLGQYPKAKVIWCHLAQIRYQSRSSLYGPALIEQWLNKYPNLYIDTAMGHSTSTYKPSGERHAHYWSNQGPWAELIAKKPQRFLAALDIGGDRMNRIEEWTQTLRQFINTLPEPAREWVAYKSAWKLLFNEEI